MTMIEDRSNALIVHSVIDLGHNLGLTIVAEGVEDERALAALAAFGCDVAQGYYLSRPVPARAFDSWYAHYVDGRVPFAVTAPATAVTPVHSATAVPAHPGLFT
jgi:sensor c-di-GMP phosphodiesterase-like protein